jgi:hypothetical protein
MADTHTIAPVVHGDSPTAVAYALLLGIAAQDGKLSHAGDTPIVKADAAWIFKTFNRCLKAANGDPSP